jgi:Tol biopolymer transport system component
VRRGSTRGALVAGVCLVVPFVALTAPGRAVSAPTAASNLAGTVRTAAPDPDLRVGYTDERDTLYERQLERADGDGPDLIISGQGRSAPVVGTGFGRTPVHEAERTGDVFISTRHHRAGEVYVRLSDGSVERVTCNDDVETHPVGDRYRVAFATDAGGDWDIHVMTRPVPGPARPAPAWGLRPGHEPGASGRPAAAAAPEDCDPDWTLTDLTDDGGDGPDDRWPTWVDDSFPSAEATTGVVFSTATPGSLEDLAFAELDDGEWQSPQLLTETEDVAESQPAAKTFTDCIDTGGPFCTNIDWVWVAFTTTEDRPDASIRLFPLEDPGEAFDPWPGAPPQSTEPAWAPSGGFPYLAFTSTSLGAGDPYGNVFITPVDGTDTPAPELGDDPGSVADESGVAESHPYWTVPAGAADVVTVGYTTRARWEDDPAENRVLDADVSDVLALDGSDRRVVVDEVVDETGIRYDEAGPSYSPGGEQVVYSTDDDPTPDLPGRELRIADADGTDVVSLADRTEHQPGDIDVDPAWSPDGSRIAFVRAEFNVEAWFDPVVWVLDLRDDSLVRVTPASTGTTSWADQDPSWSPDGEDLVVAREVQTIDPAARRMVRTSLDTTLWVVPADGSGVGNQVAWNGCADDACPERIWARTPAWSPDGESIVYSTDGQLERVDILGCCALDYVQVTAPVALTGFDAEGLPTPARAELSWADDPAWSPDGSEIAFAGQPTGMPDQRGIWAIAPDGSGLRTITDTPPRPSDTPGPEEPEDPSYDRGPETEPAWAPEVESDIDVDVTVTGSPALVGGHVTATYRVTNHGPSTASDVVLTTAFANGARTRSTAPPSGCRANGTGCAYASLSAGESRLYVVRVRHDRRVRGAAYGTVTSRSPDPVSVNDTDEARYRFHGPDLVVRIRLDEKVGYVGGERVAEVVVRNAGTDPVRDVTLAATWPELVEPEVPPPLPSTTPDCLVAGDTCDLGTIGPGGKRRFQVLLGTPTEGTDELSVSVTTSVEETSDENNEDTVELEVLQPTLEVLPGVGRPGQVVLAYGENMPPGSEIELEWGVGITVARGPYAVADDGRVRVPLLVVRRDLLGARVLTATSTEDLFDPVDGGLLVVLRTLNPPQFAGRG